MGYNRWMSGKSSFISLARALWPCKLFYPEIPYLALIVEG
jgi:hypothetical protein